MILGRVGAGLTRSLVSRGPRRLGVLSATRELSGVPEFHGTTILSVRDGKKVVMIGDSQISQGSTIVKNSAVKCRRIGKEEDAVLAGFAGSTADALTLLERLEKKLDQYPSQLTRACVELAKNWRTDKYLRKLEAIMIVADKDVTLTLTGTGDVIQSDDGIVGVGSGGHFALSAARALSGLNTLEPEDIAKRSMKVASDLCVYTNDNYTVEILEIPDGDEDSAKN